MIGVVKCYDARRGADEITRDDGRNVFVHVSRLERAGLTSLAAGDRITFDVQTSRTLQRTFAASLVLL